MSKSNPIEKIMKLWIELEPAAKATIFSVLRSEVEPRKARKKKDQSPTGNLRGVAIKSLFLILGLAMSSLYADILPMSASIQSGSYRCAVSGGGQSGSLDALGFVFSGWGEGWFASPCGQEISNFPTASAHPVFGQYYALGPWPGRYSTDGSIVEFISLMIEGPVISTAEDGTVTEPVGWSANLYGFADASLFCRPVDVPWFPALPVCDSGVQPDVYSFSAHGAGSGTVSIEVLHGEIISADYELIDPPISPSADVPEPGVLLLDLVGLFLVVCVAINSQER